MAQDGASVRNRPAVDKALLVVVLLCLGVALVRAALVAVAIPYAYYTSARLESAAKAAGATPPATRISKLIADSGPFESWWGGRRVPYREGGDYLGVLSHHSTERSLGAVIGVLAARDAAEGRVIRRVVLPQDRRALYGEEPGIPLTKADGTVVRTRWKPPAVEIAYFSDVPTVTKPYDPQLTAEQAARLTANGRLVERAEDFFVGAPRPGGSGTWILLVKPGIERTYLLVPIEDSPVGGAL